MTDDGFVKRSLRMSFAVSIFVVWVVLSLGRWEEAVSYGTGAAIALAMMWTSRFAVEKATTPGKLRGKWFIATLAITKYFAAGWIIWHFVHWKDARMLWFVAGAAVTQVVLTMKAAGQILHGDMKPIRRKMPDPRRR